MWASRACSCSCSPRPAALSRVLCNAWNILRSSHSTAKGVGATTMNRSPWKATPAVGFSQVSKVGRGSCSCRSASTAAHRDLASGSACMLLSQTGILSVSSPPGSYPGRCLSAWSPGLACLRSSAALAALAFFSCRVHSPRFRLYQWMALLMSSHLPLIQGQNSRVSRSTSFSSRCSSSGGSGLER